MHLKTVVPHIFRTLPLVNRELSKWYRRIDGAPSEFLSKQGTLSIQHKKFHCQGGSVFAAWTPEYLHSLTRFIVAFQTMSDYLDNLCDRGNVFNPNSFSMLHQSMLDVFADRDPIGPAHRYYALYPDPRDGGYLIDLVKTCREQLRHFPYFHYVRQDLLTYTKLYTDLQVYKHIHPERRGQALINWHKKHKHKHPDLYWWEFSAAAGSTLLIFALVSLSAKSEGISDAYIKAVIHAYFPWICGLHILLDYFIDQEEDRLEQDLNFVSYYTDEGQVQERLELFIQKAMQAVVELPDSPFHLTVVNGLLALYLSDEKVDKQGLAGIRQHLLNTSTVEANHLYKLCKQFRSWRIV